MGFLGSLLGWHNTWQSDASEGEYNPPSSMVDREAHRSYKDGYYHAKGEIDHSEGKYDPPAGGIVGNADNRSAYLAGYNNDDD